MNLQPCTAHRARSTQLGGLLVAAALLAVAAAPGAAEASEDVQHGFSLTISPIHLVLPVVELTGELRVADKLGLGLVAGLGRIQSTTVSGSGLADAAYTAVELGAQVRYYLFGSFEHGLQLGAEALYVYLDRDSTISAAATGEGLAVGPFLGYKIASNLGFTFEAQAGAQAMVAKAKSGSTLTSSSKGVIPLLNLNVGWSF
jgi:hypothetical protein